MVATSRDFDTQEALVARLDELAGQLDGQSFDDLLAPHVAGWAERWNKADVEINGDDEAQQGIRFNLFQLFSTYYGNDSRLNISPKGFTGENTVVLPTGILKHTVCQSTWVLPILKFPATC